ncbi:hypothetical protein J2Z42_001479 [Clostridium algifaecis]|uniref:Uncharacterized protein n=1 Tax=Clostridium algifaecis TaxID=1472040 RepID=A0ABS4KS03_9CLOT|nr:hypothetical protein [Clostridium algifaecis]MBP2032805.1 hypothetical protein [Clostridium algifaecis]
MNKKLVAMVTSLVVGSSVLLGTAYANASQLSGYEAYKTSVKDSKALKNETTNLKMSVYDNGSDIADMTTNYKINLASNAMSQVTTVKSSAGNQTFSKYKQDGKNISKSSSSDVYNVRENKNKNVKEKDKAENPEIAKSVETVIDTLVGNMKNNVSVVDNNDGTKKVSINLSENDVTPLVNALASMAIIKSSDEPMHNEKAGDINLTNVLPQLQSNIKIKTVKVTGDINKNDILDNQIAKVVLTGIDAQGKTHEITINATLDLSNINSTTTDAVDLTGKQINNVTQQFKGRD